MSARVVRSRLADRDIAEIAEWTVHRFGVVQARRYGAAIEATLHGLHRAPQVVGARPRPELGVSAWTIPVTFARTRSRHIVLFTCDLTDRPVLVRVLRILHDSMDISRHLSPDDPDPD